MSPNRFPSARQLLVIAVTAAMLAGNGFAASRKEQVLYSFQGLPDGAVPAGGVVFDQQGNLYGATTDGGANNCPGIAQCGTVYQLALPTQQGGSWTESILYVFQGKNVDDGETPAGGVLIDTAGNLYGTTAYGGTGSCVLLGNNVGCGTVYELSPPTQKGGAWTETILYSFQGGKDGYLPWGDLVFDKQSNLYGATEFGGGKGTSCNSLYQYCGTVFKLTAPKQKGGKWTEKVLHSFAGIANGKQTGDGANPNGGLALGSGGVVYGTTNIGGYNCPHHSGTGCGVAFVLNPPKTKGGAWRERKIHVFRGAKDGATPVAGMAYDGKIALFGESDLGVNGGGVVFRMTAGPKGSWRWSSLYQFGGNDGPPMSSVVLDSTGRICGTALGGENSAGLVFRMAPWRGSETVWTFSALYDFKGVPDGRYPAAPLVLDSAGHIYGTTEGGGDSGNGTVFEVWK